MTDTDVGLFVLETPYKELWRKGYLVINKEPRRNVILYNSSNDRSTVSYAKYLYEVSLGHFIPKGYIVDHIDGNQMNDTLSNYQPLTSKQNNRKGVEQNNKTRRLVDLICGCCGDTFTIARNQSYLVVKYKKSNYCSRSCASKKSKPSTLVREYRENVKQD